MAPTTVLFGSMSFGFAINAEGSSSETSSAGAPAAEALAALALSAHKQRRSAALPPAMFFLGGSVFVGGLWVSRGHYICIDTCTYIYINMYIGGCSLLSDCFMALHMAS